MLHLDSVALGPAQGPREKLGSSFHCPGPRHGPGFFLGTVWSEQALAWAAVPEVLPMAGPTASTGLP